MRTFFGLFDINAIWSLTLSSSLMITSSNGNIFGVPGPLWGDRWDWPFVRGPVDSLHKGQWRRALMFSLICAWTNGWANNRDAGDLRRHHAHYDVTVMKTRFSITCIIYLMLPISNLVWQPSWILILFLNCKIIVANLSNIMKLKHISIYLWEIL